MSSLWLIQSIRHNVSFKISSWFINHYAIHPYRQQTSNFVTSRKNFELIKIKLAHLLSPKKVNKITCLSLNKYHHKKKNSTHSIQMTEYKLKTSYQEQLSHSQMKFAYMHKESYACQLCTSPLIKHAWIESNRTILSWVFLAYVLFPQKTDYFTVEPACYYLVKKYVWNLKHDG